MRLAWVVFGAFMWLAPLSAQAASMLCSASQNGLAPLGCAATVGTAASLVLPAAKTPSSRNLLLFTNQTATGGNNLACTVDGSTPAVNGAGSITLTPGEGFTLYGPGTPATALNCIAAGSGTAMTVFGQ